MIFPGFADVSFDSVAVGSGTIVDDSDTVLAGQLAAGVLMPVGDSVSVDLGYRYMFTDDPDLDAAHGDVDTEIESHNVLIALRFYF